MSRSNDRLKAIALAMTALSTAVQGAKPVTSSAPYSGGSGWLATQALTPAA